MCSNINTHNGFLETSKRCKINCISGHIAPHIYNLLAKMYDLTRKHVDFFCINGILAL